MKLQTLKKNQIQKLFQKGHSSSHGFFVIKYIKSDNFGYAISFSKKLKLNKPKKNRHKRQIREIIKKNVCKLDNFQFIIIMLKQAESFSEMQDNLSDLFTEINKNKNEI